MDLESKQRFRVDRPEAGIGRESGGNLSGQFWIKHSVCFKYIRNSLFNQGGWEGDRAGRS